MAKSPDKPTAKSPPSACAILMPIWGTAFIRQFLDVCLPTLLAPGNIPAVAQTLPTRFVLLTRSSDLPVVTGHPAWRDLATICDTDIRAIDDLIADGNHHATVTLAYARALRGPGEALRDTVFLFLVGDYLMADGSLRTVLKRIQAGASGVLAGSLPIAADTVAPLLGDRPRPSACELALSPRLLAGWALAQLKSSGAASGAGAFPLHDADDTRFFWPVDERTLIGRFYLLHMIGIHPEVTDFVVGAPCDYAFIPEMCPSGRVEVLTDSDDYLAVEMQPRGRAAGSLRPGPLQPAKLARSLSQWTTARHRRNAETTVVFHAGDRPAGIAEADAAASAFVADVATRLATTPLPHRGHPFWIGMMALQRARLDPAGLDDESDRLLGAASMGGMTGLSWLLRLRLLGHPPNVTAWHPRWPDFRSLHATLRKRVGGTDRLLVVSTAPRAFAQCLGSLCSVIDSIATETIADTADKKSERGGAFDACAYILDGERPPDDEAVFNHIDRMLKPGGVLVVLLTADLDRQHQGDLRDSAALTGRLLQRGIRLDDARYVPAGSVRVALARAMAATIRAGRASPRAALPLLLATAASIAGAILIGNLLIWRRRPRLSPRGHCSSVLLAGRSRAEPAMSAIDCQSARGYDDRDIAAQRQAGPDLAGQSLAEAPEMGLRVEPRSASRRHRRASGRIQQGEMPRLRWTIS
jgi:hypothetical protein